MTVQMILHADPIDWAAVSTQVADRFRVQVVDRQIHVSSRDGGRPMLVELERRADASFEALDPERWPTQVRPQLVARGRRVWVHAGSSMDDFIAWRHILAALVDGLVYDEIADALIDLQGDFIDPDDVASPGEYAIGKCGLKLSCPVGPADLLAAAKRVSQDLEIVRIDELAPLANGWTGFSAAVIASTNWRRVSFWDAENSFAWYHFTRGGDHSHARLAIELDPALADPSDISPVIPQLRALLRELAVLEIRVIDFEPATPELGPIWSPS